MLRETARSAPDDDSLVRKVICPHHAAVRPSTLLLQVLLAWTVFGLAASIWPSTFGPPWLASGFVIACVAVFDSLSLPRARQIRASRNLPGRFALGHPVPVTLTIEHDLGRTLQVEIIDGLPAAAEVLALPWRGLLPAGETAALTYHLRFTERGRHEIAPAHLLASSRFGLWQRALRAAPPDSTRCYPNYEPVIRLSLLAMSHREEQMGIIKKRRTGPSLDFHQLREYQDGDVLSRIDWKATSRRNALISRDYEEQRNQTVLLVPDCGRRLRALDGEVTQFDHCLNTMLLLAHIALRQGDEVGILSFGGADRRLKPVKGAHAMPKILNHLYDYQTSPEPGDFIEAAQRVMTFQKRRALVVFLTNLRSEDASHLHTAVQLLRHRHLVMVASLREQDLEDRAARPVYDLDSALAYGALCSYLEERALLLRSLQAHQVRTVDATARQLPVALANRYLDLKASGAL